MPESRVTVRADRLAHSVEHASVHALGGGEVGRGQGGGGGDRRWVGKGKSGGRRGVGKGKRGGKV